MDWYDYGARFYDGQLARWHVIDKSAENYYPFSPYVYVGNNPLRRIDPNGNDGWDVVKGAIAAITDNAALGLTNKRKSTSYNSGSDYNLGQDIGDVISVFIGVGQIAGGGAAAGGGAVVTVGSGGALAIAGVPAIAGGVAVATHGTAMTGTAAANLMSQKGRVSEDNEKTRSDNKLKPSSEATGDHSSFKTDGKGKTTNTATYKKNPKNPSGFDQVKRVDIKGKAHNGVETPHVHEPKKPVRPAKSNELPRQK